MSSTLTLRLTALCLWLLLPGSVFGLDCGRERQMIANGDIGVLMKYQENGTTSCAFVIARYYAEKLPPNGAEALKWAKKARPLIDYDNESYPDMIYYILLFGKSSNEDDLAFLARSDPVRYNQLIKLKEFESAKQRPSKPISPIPAVVSLHQTGEQAEDNESRVDDRLDAWVDRDEVDRIFGGEVRTYAIANGVECRTDKFTNAFLNRITSYPCVTAEVRNERPLCGRSWWLEALGDCRALEQTNRGTMDAVENYILAGNIDPKRRPRLVEKLHDLEQKRHVNIRWKNEWVTSSRAPIAEPQEKRRSRRQARQPSRYQPIDKGRNKKPLWQPPDGDFPTF